MFNQNAIKTPAMQEQEQVQKQIVLATQQFRADRQKALDKAVVTTTLGNQYDADEQSLLRMGANIKAGELASKQDEDMVQWSLADTETGVMTDVPFSDLKDAYVLAAANMGQIWGRT